MGVISVANSSTDATNQLLKNLMTKATDGKQFAATWNFGDAKDPLPAPLIRRVLKHTGVLESEAQLTAAWLTATQAEQGALWQKLQQATAEFCQLFAAGADVTAELPSYRRFEGMTLRELAWQMSIDIEDLELPEARAAALADPDKVGLYAEAQRQFTTQYPGFRFEPATK
ncbi:hypothetical protein FC75_GL000179 [Lacticaseibacillus camelliae DSM 22697 = JCM 13995]|uniref:Uncharacterized protein n=2 Tax=Lacticaseibacillus camelliae TaxID=381742 RepID=A0A0R2FB77_9LACO|nr:hypothetical protein FC75_GL000179 [Lacticaseibacillus camelliae DSM 22697 = JCM 13995]